MKTVTQIHGNGGEPDEWEECCSDDDEGSIEVYTPVKKQKLSHYRRKSSSFEAAIDEQTALERDAKYQRGFTLKDALMSPRPKHKACKPTPCKADKPLSMMFGGVACQPWAKTKK